MTREIPPMPAYPPTDAGQGAHGSQPWYSRGDDIKFMDTIIVAIAGADAAGLPNAGDHLDHYMQNTGEDLRLDPDRIMNDEPGLKLHFDAIVTKAVREIAARLGTVSTSGDITAEFQSGWEDYTFASRDWWLAIGSVEAAVCGVVTAHAASGSETQQRIVLDYQCHLFDRYNWDGTKETEIAGMTWTDRELGALHTAGLAKEFNMMGSSTVKHFEGPLPTSETLVLPPPSGTGTPPR